MRAEPALWRLTPDRAREWRRIRAEALRESPGAFGEGADDWAGRPLADFAARLAECETWAAGDSEGFPRAVAVWEPGWTPGAERVGWISAVYASPSARGRGLASALLARIAERARARGMLRLGLRVGLGNRPARTLYARAGFVPSGLPIFAPGGVQVEMTRPLVLEPAGPRG